MYCNLIVIIVQLLMKFMCRVKICESYISWKKALHASICSNIKIVSFLMVDPASCWIYKCTHH